MACHDYYLKLKNTVASALFYKEPLIGLQEGQASHACPFQVGGIDVDLQIEGLTIRSTDKARFTSL